MDTRIISLIVFLFFLLSSAKAQELACGSIPTKKDIQALKSLKNHAILGDQLASDPVYIAISAHIVRSSDGTGGLTEQELAEAIEDVNGIYSLTNMTFFLFGDINYVDNDAYYDFNSDDETALTSVNNVENTINVYFFNSATSGDFAVCGYAYFPSSERDHIVMVNSCTTNGSTFPHELGHYFSLYHTHGKTNTGTTDELVDGSNCTSAGDDICDTAADPNLSGKVTGSCVYTGTDTDSNGDEYVPNPKNLMSYSQKQCRDEFSQGQADRIVSAYQTYKTYLLSKEYAAAFDVDDKAVCEGETISFTSRSVGAASYAWSFEGGTPSTSAEEDPVITYSTIGTYDVSLVITEAGGEMDTKSFIDYISVKGGVTSDLTEKAGSFEDTELDEEVINDDAGITFVQTSAAATDGSQSVYIDFLSYSQVGEIDYLIFSALNTSQIKTYTVTFDYAYATYSASYSDGLAIVYRDPCEDWITIWKKSGTDLQTKAAQTSAFVPAAGDWKSEVISIEVPAEIDISEIAFKAINGYGNNLYIDNYDVKPTEVDFTVDDIQIVDASCFDSEDGSIVIITTSSGSLSFSKDDGSFSSSNGFTNLARGEYTISVKNAEGSTLTQVVTVGSPEELLMELDVQDAPCGEGGSVSITTTGGSGSYSYNLDESQTSTSNSFSALTVGDHTIIVTDLDSDCTSEMDFSVTEVEASFEINLEVVAASCPDTMDGTITVTGLGTGYQFSIDGGEFSTTSVFENLGLGVYEFVVIDDNGCEKGREEILFAENEYPGKPEIDETANGLSITIEGSQVVQWYLDGALLAGATESTLNVGSRGSYTAEISNGDCSALSDPFIILSTQELQASIELYPNPAINQLMITLPNNLEGKVTNLTIRDFTGRILKVLKNTEIVDIRSLKSGMYLLEFSGDGFTVSKRFLKR